MSMLKAECEGEMRGHRHHNKHLPIGSSAMAAWKVRQTLETKSSPDELMFTTVRDTSSTLIAT